MNQVKGSKQAVWVPEVPRVLVHPGSAVLASPRTPHSREWVSAWGCHLPGGSSAATKEKKWFRWVKVQGDRASGFRGLQQTPVQSNVKRCGRQALTEHTRRPARMRQCLQSCPREVNVPNHPCAPTEDTQDIQEHRDKHTGLGRTG